MFLHATIVALLLFSPMSHGFTGESPEGAGGEGPTGGGGGRSGGGRAGERLSYVQVRPASPPPSIAPALVPGPPPVPVPTPPVVAPPVVTAAPGTGEGTSTGAAGTGGAGPGTGGGIGSALGTGRGTGVGPGTGGGDGLSHPPTPTQFFLPPLPAPARIKPYNLVAWFDVDEKGNARLIGFNPSRDGGYNRRLREVLQSLRFRPGVLPDGTPVRDTVDVQYSFH